MMPTVETPFEANVGIHPAPSAWREIRACLDDVRTRLQREITHYPPPIPACDADFNYLLDERARLSQVLDQMLGPATDDTLQMIAEYVASSHCVDAPVKQAIKKCLTAIALS